MRPYELMLMLDVALSEDERRDIVSEVEHEVVDLEGELVSTTQYGVRELAYPIGGAGRGDYRLIRFFGDPRSNQELQERLNYRDDLLRYLLVHVDNPKDLRKFYDEEEEEVSEEEVAEEQEPESEPSSTVEEEPAAESTDEEESELVEEEPEPVD